VPNDGESRRTLQKTDELGKKSLSFSDTLPVLFCFHIHCGFVRLLIFFWWSSLLGLGVAFWFDHGLTVPRDTGAGSSSLRERASGEGRRIPSAESSPPIAVPVTCLSCISSPTYLQRLFLKLEGGKLFAKFRQGARLVVENITGIIPVI
jgi:hypothetical protein